MIVKEQDSILWPHTYKLPLLLEDKAGKKAL
jgi:hypothetical protein